MTEWNEIGDLETAIVEITGGRRECVTDRKAFREHCFAPEALQMFKDELLGKVKTVLDFGCGVGRMMQQVKELDSELEVTGYDYPAMRRLADAYLGQESRHYSWIAPPLENLSGNRFDVIYSGLVLQHLPPDEAARIIGFLPSVLSENGKFLHVSRSYFDAGGDVWQKVNDVFKPVSGAKEYGDTEHQVRLLEIKRLVVPHI